MYMLGKNGYICSFMPASAKTDINAKNIKYLMAEKITSLFFDCNTLFITISKKIINCRDDFADEKCLAFLLKTRLFYRFLLYLVGHIWQKTEIQYFGEQFMEEKKQEQKRQNKVTILNQNDICVSGISKVLSSTEKMISVVLDGKVMTIEGENLSVSELNVETGNLSASGKVFSVKFVAEKHKENFFKRIFG